MQFPCIDPISYILTPVSGTESGTVKRLKLYMAFIMSTHRKSLRYGPFHISKSVDSSHSTLFQDDVEHQKKADHIATTILKLMDKDRDGKITPEEFEAVGVKGLPNFDEMGAEGHHYDVESGECPTCPYLTLFDLICYQNSSCTTKVGLFLEL